MSPPRQIVGQHHVARPEPLSAFTPSEAAGALECPDSVGVDTVGVLEWRMLLPSRRHGAVEDGGWCAAAESITIMRPVDVTEAQEAPEAAVQRPLLWLQV